MKTTTSAAILAIVLAAFMLAPPAQADPKSTTTVPPNWTLPAASKPVVQIAGSKSQPFWTYPAPPPSGVTKLKRTTNGLTAAFRTNGLTAGHVVTLWIMFFDNPEACTEPYACNPDLDVGKPGVRFDFHYAGGRIVNRATMTVSGHVRVGEMSTSGWSELIAIGAAPPEFATPLTNPMGAQVILAIHSHGPAQTGQDLVSQLSSYLGGCVLPFLGDAAGFAQSVADVPALTGQCSTIQVAFHNP